MPIPEHIAVIMDGNNRWARVNGVSLSAAYKKGLDAAWDLILNCIRCRITHVTLYAFSTDNWKRSLDKIESLMKLLESHVVDIKPLIENDIKVVFIGERSELPQKLHDSMEKLETASSLNKTLFLAIALSYGAQEEILSAIKSIVKMGVNPKDINKNLLESVLYTKNFPHPDLLIRTGKEKRLSNFLLWQMSYTELYFCDTLWPDFSDTDFLEAIKDFDRRERRYGV